MINIAIKNPPKMNNTHQPFNYQLLTYFALADKDSIARYLLVAGFVLTAISTGILFYTSHWTSICIVDAVEKQPIDTAELSRCITTPVDIDGVFIILSTIGFAFLTFSSAMALRKKKI